MLIRAIFIMFGYLFGITLTKFGNESFDLAAVVAAWPALPEAVRTGIRAMVVVASNTK